MEDQLFDGEEPFILNIEKCIQERSTPAVIRQVFVELRDNGYINVGEFFKNLSPMDLDLLRVIAENTHPDAVDDVPQQQIDASYESLSMLAMGLLVGEGRELTEQNCFDGINITAIYISLEHLHRIGMVKVLRENWSMGRDGDKPIVEKIDKE